MQFGLDNNQEVHANSSNELPNKIDDVRGASGSEKFPEVSSNYIIGAVDGRKYKQSARGSRTTIEESVGVVLNYIKENPNSKIELGYNMRFFSDSDGDRKVVSNYLEMLKKYPRVEVKDGTTSLDLYCDGEWFSCIDTETTRTTLEKLYEIVNVGPNKI